MRWKGTVNNYQGIICYWEELERSSVTKSGLQKQTNKQSHRGSRGSFHFHPNKLQMSLTFPHSQTGGKLKRTNKKLSKGFKFHPKKSCCCWAPRVDLYQSKSIVCHEHSSVAREEGPQCYSLTLGLKLKISFHYLTTSNMKKEGNF